MSITCNIIIYKSYTHLNIWGTQSLAGIEYAYVLECLLWFCLCENIGRAEKHSVPVRGVLATMGISWCCTVLSWLISALPKSRDCGYPPQHPAVCGSQQHFIFFGLPFYCFFYIFFYKLPINFINLPKVGPVRYWLSMSDEFGKHQPSCNAIFTQ